MKLLKELEISLNLFYQYVITKLIGMHKENATNQQKRPEFYKSRPLKVQKSSQNTTWTNFGLRTTVLADRVVLQNPLSKEWDVHYVITEVLSLF